MPTKLEQRKLSNLLWASLFVILLVGTVCYIYLRNHYRENENKEFTVTEFINGTDGMPPLKNILVGMVFGLVFGFIDNAGMFFGMDALEPFLPREGFVAAGIGNTYSSVLGAFLAAFLIDLIFEIQRIYENISRRRSNYCETCIRARSESFHNLSQGKKSATWAF